MLNAPSRLLAAALLSLTLIGSIGYDTAHAANSHGGHWRTPAAIIPLGQQIADTAVGYVGARYAWIGDTPATGFSCIGFAHYVYSLYGIDVPEALWSAYTSAPWVGRDALRPGDLVFFSNTWAQGISHVAMYIGHDEVVGADNYQYGVEVDNLDDAYWSAHYRGAARPLGGA